MSNGTLAPVPSVKIKRRPRGRPFEKGHGFGSEHRYKPGQSGNPLGRPSCKEISKALRQQLASDKRLPAKTYAERVAKKWLDESLGGNIAAIISLSNRVEGCPTTALTLAHDGPTNLHLMIEAMHERSSLIGPPEGHVERPLLEDGTDPS